ncbi:MAG: hypothetical protein IJ418_08140, partial [Clostridia bacterium]|nr:hypothetical protein [Clostridia bacterium]
ALQRYALTVDAIDTNMERVPVVLMHEQCLFILQSDASGKLTTIEVDGDASSFAVCHYKVSAP